MNLSYPPFLFLGKLNYLAMPKFTFKKKLFNNDLLCHTAAQHYAAAF